MLWGPFGPHDGTNALFSRWYLKVNDIVIDDIMIDDVMMTSFDHVCDD